METNKEPKIEHCDEINCLECQKALLVKTLKKIKKDIESAKNQTQHDTGAFKYDFAYEECLQIIDKYENDR